MATPEEDFSSLPLTERITHKIWKVRVGAYEELTKKFSKADPSNDDEFRPFDGFMKNIATDANAVAQETGLTTLLAFVENAPNPTRSRGSVIPAVVDKSFGSARAGTKNKAVELILLYIEVDTPDPVVEDVLIGLNAKQPKLVATTVFALKEIIRLYGAKTVTCKPILKALPKVFNHTDKNVRSEGTNLVIELYKWLGQGLNPILQELKPIQVKELNEAFEKLPPEKPTQTRLLRSQVAAAEAHAEAGGGVEEEAEEEKDINVYASLVAVDVLAKMNKDFYEQLGSSKWKDRKEALDALLEICKTPKIADNNYGELIGALAKRMTDANIVVVTAAANCIEALAIGLREAFGKHKSTVIGPIIEKLKERKQTVVDTLASALDAIFLSVTFDDVAEDFIAGGKHKNPQVKTETMKWLVRCLKNTKIAPNKGEIKSLTEMMVKSSEDSFEPVRVAAFEGLGTLMKVIGEKAMNPFLEGLDDLKKGKIKEFFEKAEVKVKVSIARKPPVPAATSEPGRTKSTAKPLIKSAAGASKTKKPAPSKKPAPATAPKKAAAAPPPPPPTKKGGAKTEEPLRYKFTNEEVEDKFSECVPESQTEDLGDKNWKLRLAAIETLYTTLDEMDPSEIEAELVIRFLSKKPGWKESNFQIMSKAFNIMELLAERIPSFTKSAAALAIPILIEKLGDIKLKKSAGDCLTRFAEKSSLQFLLSQAYEPLRKAKSPKILADSLTWVQGAIMEFGITGLQVRDLIDFLKSSLSSSNAAVRTNAITVLGALRIFVGPGIRTFVQDLNATQLSIIDAEFKKVADQTPPQPSKISAEFAASSGGADALEELFPKVDIGAQFTSKMIADCNDDKWKTRKEGLEQIKAIVDANQRIKPNLGDFVPILKVRLADSNKSLQMMALEICGKLATAMGKPFERYVKIFVAPVTAVLTDQKSTVRGSAIGTLECLANATGLEPLISSFATSLATDNPLLRKDLLSWLSERLKESEEKEKKPSSDLKILVPILLSCLADRNGEVRKAAQACLSPVISNAGYDFVVAKCGDLKGAVKQSIMPMIESARPTGGAAKPPPNNAGKKPGSKLRFGTSGGKREPSPEEEDEEYEEEPLPLPLPGLRRPIGRASALSVVSAPSLPLEQPQSIPLNELPPPTMNKNPNSLLKSPAPSGIGRGLPGPSRLQFSRLRRGMNGVNGAPPPATTSQDIESSRELTAMDIDPPENPTSNIEIPVKHNLSGSLNNKQRPINAERLTEVRVDIIINKIMSSDSQQSIEGLKEIDKELNGSPTKVIEHVDELVNALSLQIHMTYPQIEPQKHTLIRQCKHLVNALVLLFSSKELAPAISQDSLVILLQELAARLLDPALQSLDCGQQLSKALNVAMVKVLENSDRNSTYSALISILERSSANLRDLPQSQTTDKTKFTELIMKCLWKLAKSVQDNVKNGVLKPNQLLRDLNNFFLSTPPAEWKRRAAEQVPLGEVPLRTVKTLLLELVNGLGDGVYDHLDLIEDPQRSYVYPYLHHMLEASRKKEKQTTTANPPPPQEPLRTQESIQRNVLIRESGINYKDIRANGSQTGSPSPTFARAHESLIRSSTPEIPPNFNETRSNSSEPVSPSSPRTPMSARFPTPNGSPRFSGIDVNSKLTQIFQKIGNREETKQGILELYEFQKLHPEMEPKITAQLSKTGTYFQSYIKRGLQNIAVEEEEKQRVNAVAEVKTIFPPNTDVDHSENPEDVAYRQKLLRLQQMFGYRSETTFDRRLQDTS
ncbi:hypothetical protein G9A89_011077 [Geosiphon pyriformis]|nr:hypothetical protein G9A89_011077 [Geosiphon pyriformis]